MSHTLGPWRHEGPDMFGDHNILHPSDASAVAAVVSNLRPAEEVAANARLIAAAPDLLGALRDLLANRGPGGSKLSVERARAAIAKAAGI